MLRKNDQPDCEHCANRTRSVFCDMHGHDLDFLSESKGCNTYKKGQVIFNSGAYPHGLWLLVFSHYAENDLVPESAYHGKI